MSLERVPEMCAMYGCEAIFLIGGGLYKFGPDLVESCREFRRRVDWYRENSTRL
jgi:ribulose-bisphosphate carboxylase large chain